MAYESLTKLFHMDTSSDRFARNEELARTRLEAESTFRTGIETPNGELFLAVPRELSVLNEKVLRYERRLSAAMRALPPIACAALIRSLVIDEVVSTNDLEGVHSTRRQIADILERAEPGEPNRRREPRFGELARLYLDISSPDRIVPRTPEDVRAIYDQVMRGEPLEGKLPDGELFRRDGVEVVGQGGKVLHEGLWPESAIRDGIERMLAIASSDEVPATYGAIVSHYVFEYIHPFYDGNGRTGRYLLALFLSEPLSVLTSLSLSRTIAENRSAYYRSFKEAEHPQNRGELTGFVMNILENVRTSQSELDVELERKRSQLEEAAERLGAFEESEGLGEKEAEIVYMLVQLRLFGAFEDATQGEIADHLGLSTAQTRRYTLRLERGGQIVATSRSPLRFVLGEKAVEFFGLG